MSLRVSDIDGELQWNQVISVFYHQQHIIIKLQAAFHYWHADQSVSSVSLKLLADMRSIINRFHFYKQAGGHSMQLWCSKPSLRYCNATVTIFYVKNVILDRARGEGVWFLELMHKQADPPYNGHLTQCDVFLLFCIYWARCLSNLRQVCQWSITKSTFPLHSQSSLQSVVTDSSAGMINIWSGTTSS